MSPFHPVFPVPAVPTALAAVTNAGAGGPGYSRLEIGASGTSFLVLEMVSDGKERSNGLIIFNRETARSLATYLRRWADA